MDPLVSRFAEHLLDRRRSILTVKRYVQVLDEFSKFCEFNYNQVDGNLVGRFVQGANGQRPGASTTNVRLSALRTFFAFLVKEGLAPSNPATTIDFVPVRNPEPTFLTPREYQRLLAAVHRISPERLRVRNEAILVVLFNTGLRVAELAGLTLDMLDFGSRAFRNVRLKGGEYGSSEWNRETERVLHAWLSVRKSWNVSTQVRALFVTERVEPLSVRTIQHMFTRFSHAARLKKHVTPHVLRHSMATELLRQGFDIRVIAGILHHASLNTTKRYAHLVDSVRRDALASLEPKKPSRKRTVRTSSKSA